MNELSSCFRFPTRLVLDRQADVEISLLEIISPSFFIHDNFTKGHAKSEIFT